MIHNSIWHNQRPVPAEPYTNTNTNSSIHSIHCTHWLFLTYSQPCSSIGYQVFQVSGITAIEMPGFKPECSCATNRSPAATQVCCVSWKSYQNVFRQQIKLKCSYATNQTKMWVCKQSNQNVQNVLRQNYIRMYLCDKSNWNVCMRWIKPECSYARNQTQM